MPSSDILSVGGLVDELERDLGVSADTLVLALDVDRRTLKRWRANQSVPQGKTRQRLASLVELRDQLLEMFETRDAIREWMSTPSRALGGFSPAEALRTGRVDRVRADLDGLAAGVYL